MEIFRENATLYKYLFEDLADPRVQNWFLMNSPFGILTIVVGYLYFTLYFGPKYMENRKPYELTKVMIFYNFLQMLLSAYIMLDHLDSSWLGRYSWRCQPVDYSWTPHALREKNNQITFLHMYHHTMMTLVTWGITKYIAGGQITLVAVTNSFVHIIMYFYYMVSAMGAQYQKYIWWKKYITSLQLVQFVLTFLHSIQVLFYDCGYPKSALLITIPNSLLFYFLFSDFYKQSYNRKNKIQRAVKTD